MKLSNDLSMSIGQFQGLFFLDVLHQRLCQIKQVTILDSMNLLLLPILTASHYTSFIANVGCCCWLNNKIQLYVLFSFWMFSVVHIRSYHLLQRHAHWLTTRNLYQIMFFSSCWPSDEPSPEKLLGQALALCDPKCRYTCSCRYVKDITCLVLNFVCFFLFFLYCNIHLKMILLWLQRKKG